MLVQRFHSNFRKAVILLGLFLGSFSSHAQQPAAQASTEEFRLQLHDLIKGAIPSDTNSNWEASFNKLTPQHLQQIQQNLPDPNLVSKALKLQQKFGSPPTQEQLNQAESELSS